MTPPARRPKAAGKATPAVLLEIYQKLMERYGPQHWWPAREPFEVIVGAILTQSTAWTNVVKAINNLRAAGGLSAAALRELPQSDLAATHPPLRLLQCQGAPTQGFR